MSVTTDLVIRALSPSITIFSIPFSRFGVLPIGGRSTAIKLKNNDVFVLVSTPCDEATKAEINRMGTVRYLLTPDAEHTMNISAFHKEWPEAKCIGPDGVAEKKPDVKWTGIFGKGGETMTYGFEDEIKLHYFPGHANKEIAVLHVPSKTLLEADLLFNLPPTEQYSKTKHSIHAFWPLSIVGRRMHPGDSFHQTVYGSIGKDKNAMSRDAKVVNEWDFDRIIPCHGDVIETGGKKAWQQVLGKFL